MEQVTRIELASPAWKAGALTIVLHLRLPSVEIVSLVIIPYDFGYVNIFMEKIFALDAAGYKGVEQAQPVGTQTFRMPLYAPDIVVLMR